MNSSLSASAITALAEGSDGRLWLGDTKGQVFQFDRKNQQLELFKNIENHFLINDLLVDSSNHLWVATNGNGLFRCDIATGGVEKYESTGGLDNTTINNDAVLSLFEGQNDRIYIGTDILPVWTIRNRLRY